MKKIVNNLVVLTFFTTITLLFVTNYCVQSKLNSTRQPFGMSTNYVQLENTSNVSEIDILKYHDTQFIMTIKDSDALAIYDPSGILYMQSSINVELDKYRYFSNADYHNSTNVMIVLNGANVSNSISDRQIIHTIDNQNIESTYTHLIPYSTSLSKDIGMIYIDGKNIQEVDTVVSDLIDKGYTMITSNQYENIFDAISSAFFMNKYALFIVALGVFIYGLFCMSLYIHTSFEENKIKKSIMLGATIKMLQYEVLKKSIVLLCVSLLASILWYAYMNTISSLASINMYTLIEVVLLIFVTNTCMYSINLYIQYHKTIKRIDARG